MLSLDRVASKHMSRKRVSPRNPFSVSVRYSTDLVSEGILAYNKLDFSDSPSTNAKKK
ncbi:hypothetical protein N44_03623 [Microcystis aeruginosa NIES-44]|uniref:Uncharacterized protein n=1 Tax=Microcystis aeruginosa NIES-44 TaxID=449439 RepID=A0A0A1VX72_MICAE|nr:hypothetical protein N44_03623 [Microcystis aeruginosa NIES-44]